MITVIITETDGGIDSTNYWGYALKPTTELFADDETGAEERNGIALMACSDTADDFQIAFFSGKIEDIVSEASEALASLISAVHNNERSWDVDKFMSPF